MRHGHAPFAGHIVAAQAAMAQLIDDLDDGSTAQIELLRGEAHAFLLALDVELVSRNSRTERTEQ